MTAAAESGKFITFEGIDGAGKSTHLDWFGACLNEKLAQAGHGRRVVLTREPGGTRLGEALREIVLDYPMHVETEALLLFAARREHLATVIEPALARGDWVLSDRFTDATFAYQGGGRGLPRDRLKVLENWVQRGLQPDLTVLFDVPVETARARCRAARTPDRFENEGEVFFTRIRDAYQQRASDPQRRFVIIDATQTIDEIRLELQAIAASL